MKQCPVCKTFVFDDMDTCFACMHMFGSDFEQEQKEKTDCNDNGQETERGIFWPPPLETGDTQTNMSMRSASPKEMQSAHLSMPGWSVHVETLENRTGNPSLSMVIEPVSA